MSFSRWHAAVVVAAVMLAGALSTQSFLQRLSVNEDQVAACMRGTLDRAVNAEGWRTAERARRVSAAAGGPTAESDARAAARYAAIAASLESRTRPTRPQRAAFCHQAFPRPSVVPWKA